MLDGLTLDHHPAWHRQIGKEKGPDPIPGQRFLPFVLAHVQAEIVTHHRDDQPAIQKVPIAVEHPPLGQPAAAPKVGLDPIGE